MLDAQTQVKVKLHVSSEFTIVRLTAHSQHNIPTWVLIM